jgi:hypothetical protein
MRSARLVLLFVFVVVVVSAAAQQPAAPTIQAPQRDPQALSVLRQTLNAAGGATAIAAMQDFTAKGTITHFWAGEEVTAPATLRGRGTTQVRLDSNLPAGPRSWAVNHGTSSLYEKGKATGVPYQNGVDLGAVNCPQVAIFALLNDPQVSISAIEQVKENQHDALLIRIQKNFNNQEDPTGILTRRTAKEVLIDPLTYMPIALRAKTYPPKGFSGEFVQEIQFEDFRLVNGTLIPFVLTETISGQKTWMFRADSVVLNSGLSDADFEL